MKTFATSDAELLLEAPPASQRQGRLPFIDARAGAPNRTNYINNVIQSPAGVWGVGLHGACPPGTFLVLTPADKKEALRSYLNASGLFYQLFKALTREDIQLPSDVSILYPGDVLRFVEPQNLGVVAYTLNFQLDAPATNITDTGNPVGAIGQRPLVRWYFADPGPHARISYFKAPLQFDFTHNNLAPGVGAGLPLGPCVTQVTVSLHNAGTPETALVGTDEVVMEVWWRMHNGVWVHNDADDWDDAGRGRGNLSHTVEVYDVPRTAREVYLRRISQVNTPSAKVFVSED